MIAKPSSGVAAASSNDDLSLFIERETAIAAICIVDLVIEWQLQKVFRSSNKAFMAFIRQQLAQTTLLRCQGLRQGHFLHLDIP